MVDVTFSDATFQQDVLQSDVPVLVDFWAEWCGPCHMIAPTIDELSEEYKGKVKIGKMNVDENPATPGSYNIMSIPTLILFKGGQPIKTIVGVQPKDVFKQALDEALAS